MFSLLCSPLSFSIVCVKAMLDVQRRIIEMSDIHICYLFSYDGPLHDLDEIFGFILCLITPESSIDQIGEWSSSSMKKNRTVCGKN